MTKLNILLILIILICSISSVQAGDPYFKKQSKALLFEFSGLDNLGANSFNGGIGGKYFINNRMAVRGSLQFMTIDETIPFQGTGGFDGEAQADRFGISAAIEVHFDTSRVNPYFGGGLGIAFTSTESRTAEADPTDQVVIKNDTDGEFGYYGGTEFTLFGMIGVEIFIFDKLSLAAEYRLGYGNNSRKDMEVTQGNTTTTFEQGSIKGFGLESSGALILAVYF
jgi:hypothetical protein